MPGLKISAINIWWAEFNKLQQKESIMNIKINLRKLEHYVGKESTLLYPFFLTALRRKYRTKFSYYGLIHYQKPLLWQEGKKLLSKPSKEAGLDQI